jgi:hypothetical protein
MSKNTKIFLAVVIVLLGIWYFVAPKLINKETTKIEYKDTVQTVVIDSIVIDSSVVDSAR